MKILAIDDLRDNLIALEAVITNLWPGARVLTALKGAEGLALARAEDPDVVVLDIVMPDMNGYDVCRILKQDPHLGEIPVLFLTAQRGDRESRVEAIKAGAEGFLAKPIDELELETQIRAMVRLREANRFKRSEMDRLATLVAERTRELEAQLAERQRAEDALRASEMRLRLFLDASPDICFLKDLELRYLLVNAANERFFAVSGQEVLGRTDADFLPPDPARVCAEGDRRAMKEMQTVISVEEVRGRTYETRKIPVVVDGGVVGVAGIIRDVTDFVRTDRELREKVGELQRWHDATLGRENRVLELKLEVNQLLAESGRPPRYGSVDE